MSHVLLLCLTLTLLLAGSGCVGGNHFVPVKSKASVYHLGSIDSFDKTPAGTQAATLILDCLENNNIESARRADAIYRQIIPIENFGGEYTALQWFAQYLMADDDEKRSFLRDPYVDAYFHFFADNDWAVLKEYIKRKYETEILPDHYTKTGVERRGFLEDFILFNNPRREEWEKSSKIISVIPLRSGDKVIDIGSGPGYYTFAFADLVGPSGHVYAVDTKKEHLDYITQVTAKNGVKNITPVLTDGNSLNIDDRADCAFMCSVYHIIYGMMKEEDRSRLIESIKKSLKPSGRFIVVDNDLVIGKEIPYHGPYIVRELIITQLAHYGFRLEAQHQFTPQRYVLMFKPMRSDQ